MTRRRAAATITLLFVILALFAWFQRRPIAEGAIANELARRGVPATYRIADIGFRWQRIENVVIGNPRAPDLTADWAEIRLAAGLGGVRATEIRAGGVRLRGRLADGKISLGAVDKLLPKPTGAPFALPDIDVVLSDAQIALATPYGPADARIDGRGKLSDGFRGKMVAVMPRLTAGTCTADALSAYVDLSIRDRRPSIQGPVRAQSAICGDVRLNAPSVALDAGLTEAFDRWHGTARVAVAGASVGSNRATDLSGRITFSGNGSATNGTAQLSAETATMASTRLAGLRIEGRFGVEGSKADARGTVRIAQVAPDRGFAGQMAAFARSAAGSPAGPLIAKLAQGLTRASRNLTVNADFAALSRPSGASAIVTRLIAHGDGGAVLRVEGGEGVRFGEVGLLADTQIALSGGDLPNVTATLQRTASGATQGLARIAPYAAGNAQLALQPVRFIARPDGSMRFETFAQLSGPLGDGRVERLRAPLTVLVDSRGAVAVNPGCAPVAFQALSISGLRLAPATLRLCPAEGALVQIANGRLGGGARIEAPRLAGRLGSTPLTLVASRAQLMFANNGIAVSNLSARLGSANRITSIDIDTLSGRTANAGLAGQFGGLSGQIGNVPLLIDSAAGRWTFTKSELALTGTATVSDTASKVRFNRLFADDIRFRLAEGQIAVTGMLREPKTRAAVSIVTIAHNLARGTGSATLDVADLRFDKALQPEMITPLTLGVIANVQGSVRGRGEIAWSPQGVKSTGRFATTDMDLAAAFGPVEGLSSEIVFTDLLGLETGPGQVAAITSINPGIPVLGGKVTYRLAAGQKIVVEGGRWPFAGGALVLDPAALDMGESRERRLTFRVEGLDAAKFIQQLEFENFAATGLFDGAIPMIFDEKGGRIEGGRIVARRGGGTLAYVGEVSNAEMNVYAKLAFDALKSIRYNNLTIALDGPLDGEMVSRVDFTGTNEAPTTAKKSFLLRALSKLPFKFNITIRAPFRQLLSTARSFQDPSVILRQLAPLPPPVQPSESEKRP